MLPRYTKTTLVLKSFNAFTLSKAMLRYINAVKVLQSFIGNTSCLVYMNNIFSFTNNLDTFLNNIDIEISDINKVDIYISTFYNYILQSTSKLNKINYINLCYILSVNLYNVSIYNLLDKYYTYISNIYLKKSSYVSNTFKSLSSFLSFFKYNIFMQYL